MSTRNRLTELAAGALSGAVDWVRFAIWVVPTLLIMVALALSLFVPVFAFIANHWVSIVVAVAVLIGALVTLVIYHTQPKSLHQESLRPECPPASRISDTDTYSRVSSVPANRRANRPDPLLQSKQPIHPPPRGSVSIHVFAGTAELRRPTGGRDLFAYTDAWLTLAGMFSGRPISRSAAIRIAGSTMVSYHIKQGNLTNTERGLALTPKGHALFYSRKSQGHAQSIRPADAAAWTEFFSSGTGAKAHTPIGTVERITL